MSRTSRSLPSIPSAQLRPLRNRLRQSIRDAGLTDLSPPGAGQSAAPTFWDLDPTPLIIDADEWRELSAGIVQRARLVNAFLHDLYTHQEAMRSGLVPPEYTLADSFYRRPCLGLTPDRIDPATLIRFDLIKNDQGWCLTETHTNTPVGLSYAVQNRRFLTQEAADYYRSLPDYHSIVDTPLQLVDHLRQLAPPRVSRPSMVFLTTGPRYPFFSEHSFLARKMGLRLAQGDDLLVLDNRVYFKTVSGLEPVDVIYRRVNDAHIDPVVFSTDFQTAGIPGLMQCIRAGTVVVTNAIGAGVAENRALNAFWPHLSRFYLGETLRLPSLPTWLCTDTDHVDAIIERGAELQLHHTHPPLVTQSPAPPPRLRKGRLPRAAREHPAAFVAHPPITSLPFGQGSHRRHGYRLSVYAFTSGQRVSVVPGGIVNLGPEKPPRDRVGHTADVLVLSTGRPRASGTLADFETTMPAGADLSPPGSRAAETLFWLGRYLERAESTARMLGILEDVALEDIPAQDRARWLPLWRGLLAATGHEGEKIDSRTNPRQTLTGDLLWRMTLDRQNPCSLLNTVTAAANNAREMREFVSPEAGRILSEVDRRLAHFASHSPTARNHRARTQRNHAAHQAVNVVHIEINACLASISRTMLQDAGWHFLQCGKLLERAIFTASTLTHVLPEAARAAQRPDAEDDGLLYRDNPELSALLRLLGSQDAYRRLYHTRSQPIFVAQLLLQQPMAPRSILHNLRQMQAHLHAIERLTGTGTTTPLAQQVEEQSSNLSALDLPSFFDTPAATPAVPVIPLDEELDLIATALNHIHEALSDLYFSHQAQLGLTDPQTELGL